MVLILLRCDSPVSQSRTRWLALIVPWCPGGIASSTKDTNRQRAPVHFWYGWTPNPPPLCCPISRVRTLGPTGRPVEAASVWPHHSRPSLNLAVAKIMNSSFKSITTFSSPAPSVFAIASCRCTVSPSVYLRIYVESEAMAF